MAAARQTLRALGAVEEDGRATPRGIRLARTGLHPRLARALVDGAPAVGARRAAEVVALLSEEPPRALGDDLGAVRRTVRDSRDPYARRWREEVRRLLRGADDTPATALPDTAAVGLVVALAFPERIARARVERPGPGERSPYLMASGTAAELAPGTALGALPWLAVAVADRPAGSPSARVLHAAALDVSTARLAGAPLLASREEVHWSTRHGEVTARRVESLGAVELASAKLDRPEPALVRAALLEGLAREGVSTLLAWPSPACANAWPSCMPRSATPGPTSATPRSSNAPRNGWNPNSPAPAAAPTSPASTPPPPSGACSPGPPARPGGWTSWRRSGSRCRPAPGSGSTTAANTRCWR